MKSNKKALLFTSALMLILSSIVGTTDLLAEPPKRDLNSKYRVQPGSHTFSIHDIDRNGTLSREEYRIFVEKIELRRQASGRDRRDYPAPLRFEEIDGNEDEQLSEDEMISTLNKRLQRHRRYRYQGGR
ncbi:MAG: hypothetical protein KDI74_16210 [Gammaproteobacteria bacterium]|nr:hypothetical protein [Gammaproteobacteria bacterium]